MPERVNETYVESEGVRQLVQDDQYRLTRHARDEGRVRHISVRDIEDAIASGQVIETHIDD